jgi:dCMP deaminase
MFNPQKRKYHDLYWDVAHRAANSSIATRHKVGAVVVTPTGMISLGWNGMPPGFPDECESTYVRCDAHPDGIRPKTNPEVLHAEQNALDKMAREGVPTEGSILFVTRAPCLECAKRLCALGLTEIWYDVTHDDMRGVEMLNKVAGLVIRQRHSNQASNGVKLCG